MSTCGMVIIGIRIIFSAALTSSKTTCLTADRCKSRDSISCNRKKYQRKQRKEMKEEEDEGDEEDEQEVKEITCSARTGVAITMSMGR